jgi:hypothetical protein
MKKSNRKKESHDLDEAFSDFVHGLLSSKGPYVMSRRMILAGRKWDVTFRVQANHLRLLSFWPVEAEKPLFPMDPSTEKITKEA